MLEMANPERGSLGVEDLADHLIRLFEHELRQKRYGSFNKEPLEDGELPEIIAAKYKLHLVKYYFDNETGYKFPKLMKQLKSEDNPTYEARVKNYLFC